MEANGYYVRLRGRVSGPYALGELQRLVERGALSRFHEISRDQIAWSAAGRFESLFGASPAAPAAAAPTLAVPRDVPPQPPPPPAARLMTAPVVIAPTAPAAQGQPTDAAFDPSDSRRFYYRQRGITVGPMQWGKLRELAGSGKVDPAAEVWSAVGEQPTPAANVPGLIFPQPPTADKPVEALSRANFWTVIAACGLALLTVVAAITYLVRMLISG